MLSALDGAVHFQTQHLMQGRSLHKAIKDDGCISVIYGEGGGCSLCVVGSTAGLWTSLRGIVCVNGMNRRHTVLPREALVTEYDSDIKAIGRANARWLAVVGAERAWRALLLDSSGQDIEILPELQQTNRDFMRKVLAVARSSSPLELEGSVHAIADEIVAGQATLRAAIDRCPGRTHAKRRQVFLRLQRVRNFMEANCDEELDNGQLARMANYSPCHFLRTFDAVFLETPHAYLVHLRLQRARRLLQLGNLAVTDVALSSGFESRSAFSRLFRQRFGITAREATRRHQIAIKR